MHISLKSVHIAYNQHLTSFESLLLNKSYLTFYVDILLYHNSHCIEINALIQP